MPDLWYVQSNKNQKHKIMKATKLIGILLLTALAVGCSKDEIQGLQVIRCQPGAKEIQCLPGLQGPQSSHGQHGTSGHSNNMGID